MEARVDKGNSQVGEVRSSSGRVFIAGTDSAQRS